MEENFRIFIEMLKVNPEGLFGIDEKTAEQALQWCWQEGVLSVPKLLGRVLNSSHPEYLFSVLFNCLDKLPKRYELLEAVMRTPERIWENAILDLSKVAEKFSSAEDFEYILKHHRDILLDAKRPDFAKYFSADEYWLKRVRWYIGKSDVRRAWDELKKAWHGFFIGPNNAPPWERELCPDWYRYVALKSTLAELVPELYVCMLSKNLVQPITEEDHVVRSAQVKMNIYRISKRGTAEAQYQRSVVVAGFEFARIFRQLKEQHGDIMQPLILADEGAMILKIAEYFRQQRNAKRRQKWEAASAQLERSSK